MHLSFKDCISYNAWIRWFSTIYCGWICYRNVQVWWLLKRPIRKICNHTHQLHVYSSHDFTSIFTPCQTQSSHLCPITPLPLQANQSPPFVFWISLITCYHPISISSKSLSAPSTQLLRLYLHHCHHPDFGGSCPNSCHCWGPILSWWAIRV